MKKLLLSLYHYFCFFLVMAFVITCCMLLFLSTMSKSMGIEFSEANINTAAILTFWNVVFLSLILTVIDASRRKFSVDRPVKKIISAAERIADGDYSVRIPPLKSFNRADGLDKIVDCFNKMAKELSGVETLRSDFIANVSHELKTPLSVIGSYAALLKTAETSEERIRYADAIGESSRRLADLVSNILKLNKLENTQVYLTVKPYELGESLCKCLLDFESIWEEKGIEIETHFDEEIYVNTDPELLSIVWNNLISNALKFTESGGRVNITLSLEKDFASVKICDSGCGIKPEVGKRMFDKFYQGDSSHKKEGNGLGLALVKRVVDIVNGEISVESNEKGSVFTVKVRCLQNEL